MDDEINERKWEDYFESLKEDYCVEYYDREALELVAIKHNFRHEWGSLDVNRASDFIAYQPRRPNKMFLDMCSGFGLHYELAALIYSYIGGGLFVSL